MTRRCPVCNALECRELRHIEMETPDNVSLPKSYDVVSCCNCGFSYARTRGVSQEDYNEYYSINNDYSDEKIKVKVHKELNSTRAELVRKYIPLDAEILDVGCGNGDFLAELKENGYQNLQGMDPGEDSVQVVKKRGICAEKGNLFDGISENEKYDVVCCTAVLEHIYDLNRCIGKLKSRLKGQGSKIFVDVPGMEGINKYYAMSAEHFNCEHINYFTFQSLDNLFCMNGLKRISKMEDYRIFLKENNVPILSIGAVYELDDTLVKRIEKDTESADAILQYFSIMEERMVEKKNSLQKKLMTENEIVVWGGGNYALQMLSTMPELREKIRFFIDSNHNKVGRKIAGKEIKGLDKMPKDGTLIVICSMNYADEMAQN